MLKSLILKSIEHSPTILLIATVLFELSFAAEIYHKVLPDDTTNVLFLVVNIILSIIGTVILFFANTNMRATSLFLGASAAVWAIRGVVVLFALSSVTILVPMGWFLLSFLMAGFSLSIYYFYPRQVIRLFELNKRVEELVDTIQTKLGDLE